jgi:hypothetical protein
LTILCKWCHFCGEDGTLLDFLELIKSKVDDNESTFLNVNPWRIGNINVTKGILIVKKLFSRSHILRIMSPGIDKSSQNLLLLELNFFLIGHLGRKLFDLDENLMDIDSWYEQDISVVFLELDNLTQIIFIHAFLNSDVRIFLELGLFCFLDHEQVGVVFVFQSVNFLNVYINESLESLSDGLFISSFDINLSRVLFPHGHGWGDFNLKLLVFGFLIMLGFFQDRKHDFVLLSHLALDRVRLVVLRWREQHLIFPPLVQLSLIHFVDFLLGFARNPFQDCLLFSEPFPGVDLLELALFFMVAELGVLVVVLFLVAAFGGLVLEHGVEHGVAWPAIIFLIFFLFSTSLFIALFVLLVFLQSFVGSFFPGDVFFVETFLGLLCEVLFEELLALVVAFIWHLLCDILI